MCGITGLYAFNDTGKSGLKYLGKATAELARRGPDDKGIIIKDHVGLGHRRLAVIDLSEHARQPMLDDTGRYLIVFNGEIFNFKSLGKALANRGFTFSSSSDTEVFLKMYAWKGPACLNELHGFFSVAIYDQKEDELFLARDRFGVKPLLYFADKDQFIFGSEMKAILAYGISKELDYSSLAHYLQLNYVPAPDSMLKNVKKLMPGHYLRVREGRISAHAFYNIPYSINRINTGKLTYEQQQEELRRRMDEAVRDRLVADVPLGSFLSGGIDSSIIVSIASRYTEKLNTFSIGYADDPFFDETRYANLVARKFNTHHTVFKLTKQDLYQHLFEILDYIDEPFADSSAIPTFLLCRHTKETSTVALSGDGADEVFSGYHKHSAAFRASQRSLLNQVVGGMAPLWKFLPQSRNNPVLNKFRQLERYSSGLQMDPQERYWRWATFMDLNGAISLLSDDVLEKTDFDETERRRVSLTGNLNGSEDFNQILYADMRLVLPNDMLTKVDMMSMANGLEVRCPFLDHRLVEFAFQLPVESKINRKIRKRILQDAYKEVLPPEIYGRPKHGFEVPLLKWFRNDLKSLIFNDLLDDAFISEQKIFNPENIKKLKQKLLSHNPGDAHAQIWALIVFQWWWKKYFLNNEQAGKS